MRKLYPYLFLLPFLIACTASPDLHNTGQTPMAQAGINWGYPHRGRENYEIFDELKISCLRVDFFWHKLESSRGEWNFSDNDRFFERQSNKDYYYVGVLGFDTPWIHDNPEDIRQIDRDDFENFLNYVEQVVTRYGDIVDEWEIWNEPNLPFNTFWTGTDRDFLDLTLATAERIRTIDPEAVILVGSLWRYDKSYLKKLDESGVLSTGDHLSFHPYYDKPSKIKSKTIQLMKNLENRDFSGGIRVTEVGFNTSGITPTSCPPEQQGRMVMETLVELGELGAPYIIWYNLYNREDEGRGIWVDKYGILLLQDEGELIYKTGGWALRRYNELIAGKFPNNLPDFATTGDDKLIFSRFYSSSEGTEPDTILLMTDKRSVNLRLSGLPDALIHNCADGAVKDMEAGIDWTLTYENPLIITSPHISHLNVTILK
ncbi:MAG: hypothetical protein PQJ59_03905 [Spirochaetales bacterium]|nr:hypothetical protein [Spirochaetales bacterium]